MGPSGVGKTTLANLLVNDCNFVHVDYDQWGGDTDDFGQLRIIWQQFKKDSDVVSFKIKLEKYIPGHAAGAVLSFPSDDMLVDLDVLEDLQTVDVHVFILYASASLCRAVFENREKINGRGLPVSHWDKCNAHIYKPGYLTDAHAPYVLEACVDQSVRRTSEDLIGEIKNRIYVYNNTHEKN